MSVDEVERNVHIAAAVRPMRSSRLRPLEAGGGDARADVDGLLRSLGETLLD